MTQPLESWDALERTPEAQAFRFAVEKYVRYLEELRNTHGEDAARAALAEFQATLAIRAVQLYGASYLTPSRDRHA